MERKLKGYKQKNILAVNLNNGDLVKVLAMFDGKPTYFTMQAVQVRRYTEDGCMCVDVKLELPTGQTTERNYWGQHTVSKLTPMYEGAE